MRRSCGNHHAQVAATSTVATPPSTTARTVPNHCGRDAGFELAQLVRRADEHRVHRADAAADLVRRFELHQQVTHVHADHVGRAEHDQRDERDDEVRATGRTRPSRHRTRRRRRTSSARRVASSGRTRSTSAHSAAPTPGAVRSKPSPHRADVQNVARVHRQQRRGAAEQHGEQIERDRAEHDRLRAHEASGPTAASASSTGSRCARAFRRRCATAQHEHSRKSASSVATVAVTRRRHRRGTARRPAPGPRSSRPGTPMELTPPRGEQLRRHEVRHQRLRGRHRERARRRRAASSPRRSGRQRATPRIGEREQQPSALTMSSR